MLQIGSFCSIAGGVTIFFDNGDHYTEWVAAYPLEAIAGKERAKSSTKGNVIIENDVWVGDNATILSGVHIGNGAIIGAGSVVTKDVPSYSVVAGNPARVVKMRFTQTQIQALERICWWNWTEDKIQKALPLLRSPLIEKLITKYE